MNERVYPTAPLVNIAIAIVGFMAEQGFFIVHVSEVEAVPPSKPWRWKR